MKTYTMVDIVLINTKTSEKEKVARAKSEGVALWLYKELKETYKYSNFKVEMEYL